MLTNINQDGSTSMGLHGDMKKLQRDAYSADWGIGFYGHWKTSGCYVTCELDQWECNYCHCKGVKSSLSSLLGDVDEHLSCKHNIVVSPEDAFKRRLYLAILPMLVVVEGAYIKSATVFGKATGRVQLSFGDLQANTGAPQSAYIFVKVSRR